MPELETQLRELVDLSPPTTPPLSADELRRRAADHGSREVRRRAPFVLAAAAAVVAIAVLGAVAIGRNSQTDTPGQTVGTDVSTGKVSASTKAILRATVDLRHALYREAMLAMRYSGSAGAIGRDDFEASQLDTDEAIAAWRAVRPAEGPESLKAAATQIDSRTNQLRTQRVTAINAYADGRNVGDFYGNFIGEVTDVQEWALDLTDAPLYRSEWRRVEATADLARVADADALVAMKLLLPLQVGYFPTILPKASAAASRLDQLEGGCGTDAARPTAGNGSVAECRTYSDLEDARARSTEAVKRFTDHASPDLKVEYRLTDSKDPTFAEGVNNAIVAGGQGNDLSGIDDDAVQQAAIDRLDALQGFELRLIDSL